MPRYQLIEGKSAKFWEITRDGAEVTTRWGRIGSDGQTKTKAFADEAAAEAAVSKQTAAKVKKGYALDGDEDDDAAGAPAPKAKAKPRKAKPPEPENDGLAWVDAEDGYRLAIEDGKLACRNSKGKRLASVPKKLKQGEVAEQLLALIAHLAGHAQRCRGEVERWMLRALPVPTAALLATWADPAWREPLQHAVLHAGEVEGLLTATCARRGLGLIDIDGETQWCKPATALLPHPVLLEELDEWRELAAELGIAQGIPQLMRETFARDGGESDEEEKPARDVRFANGRFEQLRHAIGRCRSAGYKVSGGYAVCPIWEGGRMGEARYWIGADDPESEAWTGELLWVDEREQPLTWGAVGPTAYSEGVRMASLIYAGRVVKEEER